MRETYNFKQICKYLKIDINKMVNINELWDILSEIKSKFNIEYYNEKGFYCFTEPQKAIGFKLAGDENDKHPLFMWLEHWEVTNDYKLIGFEFNDRYDRNKKIK